MNKLFSFFGNLMYVDTNRNTQNQEEGNTNNNTGDNNSIPIDNKIEKNEK